MFNDKHKTQLSVSDLSLYFSCPRKLYYSCRGYEAASHSSLSYIEHLILKEMAISYPHMLNSYSSKDDVVPGEIESLLSKVVDNLNLIYPAEMRSVAAEDLAEISETIQSYFPEIQNGLRSQSHDPGILLLAGKISATGEEPFLHSDKLSISGMPYRLIQNESSFEPVIIKTGRAPENGVWSNDRLHVAAFAIIAEETNKSPILSGHVLYAKSGVLRHVNIRAADRRQVLTGISRARKIKDGTMPDRKESPLCDTCGFAEICIVKPSLASKFF